MRLTWRHFASTLELTARKRGSIYRPTPSYPETRYQPDDRHDNSEPDQYDGGNYPRHEEPVLQAGAPGFASGIALEQLGVFGVTPKPDGENVAEDGNGADQRIGGKIQPHANQYDFWDIQLSCDNENRRACDIREGIADPGDQSQDGIEADSYGRARDCEPLVQQIGQEPGKQKAVRIGESRH